METILTRRSQQDVIDYQFLHKMFQDIKQTNNAERPDDEEQNKVSCPWFPQVFLLIPLISETMGNLRFGNRFAVISSTEFGAKRFGI